MKNQVVVIKKNNIGFDPIASLTAFVGSREDFYSITDEEVLAAVRTHKLYSKLSQEPNFTVRLSILGATYYNRVINHN